MNKILNDKTAEALRRVVFEFFSDIPQERLAQGDPITKQKHDLYDRLYREAEDFFLERVIPF